MKLPTNSPYQSSKFFKDCQQTKLIFNVMRHPTHPIDFTNQPQLPQRKTIAIIFLRILHQLKMAFNKSGYRTPFIQAAIKIESARTEKQKRVASILNPLPKTTVKTAPPKAPVPEPINPVQLPTKPIEPPKEKRVEKVDLTETQPIPQGCITTGQGEYIVFHQLENGEIRQPSPETFEKAYQMLLKHKPRTLAKQSMEACENRHALLNAALESVDPSLQAVFVPKTLYELVFIRKNISEDLKHNSICERVSRKVHEKALDEMNMDETKRQQFHTSQAADIAKRKCWHICFFRDEGDDQHEGIKKMAFRMNKVLLKTLKPSAKGFTFKDIQEFGKKELTFLKTYYKETQERNARGEKILWRNNDGGPTTNFVQKSDYTGTYPMAIQDENVAQIVRNALTLDCSELAKNSLFIFRGSNFEEDSLTREMKPYSLSYGTSLFAGCIFDGGATAFYFMRS